jgi:hypothetical protein
VFANQTGDNAKIVIALTKHDFTLKQESFTKAIEKI